MAAVEVAPKNEYFKITATEDMLPHLREAMTDIVASCNTAKREAFHSDQVSFRSDGIVLRWKNPVAGRAVYLWMTRRFKDKV